MNGWAQSRPVIFNLMNLTDKLNLYYTLIFVFKQLIKVTVELNYVSMQCKPVFPSNQNPCMHISVYRVRTRVRVEEA